MTAFFPAKTAHSQPTSIWRNKGRAGLLLVTWISALLLILTTGAMAQETAENPFADDNPFASDEGNPFTEADPLASGEADPFADAGAFTDSGASALEDLPLRISGFLEVERSARLGESDNHEATWVMANQRLRLKGSGSTASGGFDFKLDLIQDDYRHETRTEVRQARIRYTPAPWVDLSFGRQVSTWGVGDLVFINDLFPKNWVNMFSGRDIESLKDTSDAIRSTLYFGDITLDVVWTPEFAPDTTPTGCRFSVYNPNAANPANTTTFGQETVGSMDYCDLETEVPEKNGKAENGEIAMRLATRIGSQQVALYGYNGFWKNPKGLRLNEETFLFEGYYPRMGAYGLSSEGQMGPGIFFFEAGQYLSYEDLEGKDPLIENSIVRAMVGYRYDYSAQTTFSGQVFSEKMQNYQNYEDNLPDGFVKHQEVRNTYTLRWTQTAYQETLRFSLFAYHRPEHHDGYLRYWLSKRINNQFEVTMGGNLFSADPDWLLNDFAMLHQDDNFYGRVKYIF